MRQQSYLMNILPASVRVLVCLAVIVKVSSAQSKLTVYQTTLGEPGQKTPEVTTEEVQRILVNKSEPLLDVRSAQEYAIAHVPGSINLKEKEVERIVEAYPDKEIRMVLYCNGPFCGKSKRTSEELLKAGYTHERRYQLGLPVWRALGNTVQTDLEGFRYVFRGDKTAIYVDARNVSEFGKGSVPGAVNVQAGEAEKANEDGRLPHKDKGTRVIIFAGSQEEARRVTEEIAHKAYWNSSYFGGAFAELKSAGLW